MESGAFYTRNWPGQLVSWKLTRPQDARATVVALHGMGGHGSDWVDNMHIQRYLAGTGLAVIGVDGAAAYWHPRRVGPYAGSDTAAMIVEDVMPLLSGLDLPNDRVGLLGMSMGGWGAYYVASLLGRDRVFGIATLAAALRTGPEGTIPERFDDTRDYWTHDVFRRSAQFTGIPIWLACGDADRFRQGNEAFAEVVPHAETVFDAGGHTSEWFRDHMAPAVTFLADHADEASSRN